jgi:Phosphoadenosine phosphosulfate reductase family/ParB/Sulfiredoxin domain
MIIKKMKIGDIQIAEYNPRIDLQPGDPEYEKIKQSIDEFDLVEPLIVNKRNNRLVGGHQRLKVLQVRGDTHVQVSIVDLDEPHEKALNIALNKTGGDWDKNKLSIILSELSELADMDDLPDFDVDLSGFDTNEIDTIFHDQEVHDAKYKPGEGSITGDIQFIEDEIKAMTPDDECQAMFKDKKIIYISYSGGKDSSFALLWAKTNYPDKHIIAVFSDTGVEFPGFTAHIHKSCTFLEVEYKIVKPRVDIWINMLKYGWPSIIHRQCQPTLIYEQINRIYKEHEPEDIIILDGSRADQVARTTRKT